MKKILILLALTALCNLAHADVLASMPNSGGGRIDLYDIPMPDNSIAGCEITRIAKAWTGSTSDVYGCWKLSDNGTVIIKWDSGEFRTYSVTGFSLTKPTNTQSTSAKKGSM